VNLSGGTAALSLPGLTTGNHSIVAIYAGSATYAASSSPTLVETVNQANSATSVAANPQSATVGQNVTFTAAVSPSGATGSVQFLDGSSVIGTAALSNGTAAFSTAALPYGTHSITAAYSGDVNFKGSMSAVVVQVARLSTATSLASSPNPSTFATAVMMTATVSPAGATGTVQFFSGSSLVGTANLAGGRAQLSVASLPAGSLSLTAVYSGDATYAPSTSAARVQTVNVANSKTTLSANPAPPAAAGETVTFTATITPALATGSVQFMDGNKTLIGTASVSNGVAVFSTSSLDSGNHSITADYLGDRNVNPSHSAAMAYKIK
jgi:large repetitive protein